MKKMQS